MAGGLKVRFLVPVSYGIGTELKSFEAGEVYEFPTSERDGVKDLIQNNFAEKASGSDKPDPDPDPAPDPAPDPPPAT